MVDDVRQDQLVLIKIDGMHCHKCQKTIQKSLQLLEGVKEVEVDFPSGLASVLFDPNAATVRALMEAVSEAGYQPTGFSKGEPGHVPSDVHPH